MESTRSLESDSSHNGKIFIKLFSNVTEKAFCKIRGGGGGMSLDNISKVQRVVMNSFGNLR